MAKTLPQLLRKVRHQRSDQPDHDIEGLPPRAADAPPSPVSSAIAVGQLADAGDRAVEAELLQVLGHPGDGPMGFPTQSE